MPSSPPARDPGSIKDSAREILAGRDFARSKSLIERALGWLGDRLRIGNAFGAGPGLLGDLVSLLIVGLAIALLVWLVVRWRPKPKHKGEPEPVRVVVDDGVDADGWARRAEQLEADGQLTEALRARYRELVARLAEGRALVDAPAATTGELREQVHEQQPAAIAPFDELTTLFEATYYGGDVVTATEIARAKHLAAGVLDGVQRRATAVAP